MSKSVSHSLSEKQGSSWFFSEGNNHRAFARWAPAAAIGVLLSYLVLVPLALIVLSSFRPSGFPTDPGFTLANYFAVYGDPNFFTLLETTLSFGIGSTALALICGLCLAWLIERSDLPGRRILRGLVLLPMATPPVLLAIAWAMLLSPRNGAINQALMGAFSLKAAPFNIYSLPGLIFVQGLALVPTAYLFLSTGFANMDPSLEEAAIASGAGTWTVLRRIMLPILFPSILSATVFLLIVSLVVFDIPGILGTPAHLFVLSSKIYYLVADSPGGLPLYGQVSALAMLFLLILLFLGWTYSRAIRDARRFRAVTGKGFRPRSFPLGRFRPFAVAGLGLYFLLATIAPFFILTWTSLMPYQVGVSRRALGLLTLENHIDFLHNDRVLLATQNSFTIALASATACAALALAVSWLTLRIRVPGYRFLDGLAFIPVAIPGVMIGVALIYVYLTLSPILPIYGTIWIIAVAYLTQYLPFGTRTIGAVLLQIHPELEEAAQTSGAGRVRILRRVTLPLVWPAIAAVWIWVAAHALRELSSALMLQGRANVVIPTLLWDSWSGGEPNRTAAGGLWLSAALVVFLVAWQAISSRAGLEKSR
jgi:iron(III) transport system permease protein